MPATATKHTREHTSPLTSGDHLEIAAWHLMTPGDVTIPEDASLRHVYQAMTAHRVRAVLVVGRSEGVISELDLVALQGD